MLKKINSGPANFDISGKILMSIIPGTLGEDVDGTDVLAVVVLVDVVVVLQPDITWLPRLTNSSKLEPHFEHWNLNETECL